MAEMTTAARLVFSSSQSQRGPSSSAYSRQPRKVAISTSPVTSKPRSSEKSGWSMSIASHTTAATKRPGTMLTRNIQCHEKVDRKSTRLNSSHTVISYAVFCLKKKKKKKIEN